MPSIGYSTNSPIILEKLKGTSNYELWRIQMKLLLRKEGLWLLLNQPIPGNPQEKEEEDFDQKKKEYDTWKERAERAASTIILGLSPALQTHVADMEDPKDVWNQLENLYALKGFTGRELAYRNFMSTTLGSSNSMEDYIEKLRSRSQTLDLLKAPLHSWQLVSHLLHNLGETYNNYVSSYTQTMDSKEPDFDTLCGLLLDEERRRNINSKGTSSYMVQTRKEIPIAQRGGIVPPNAGNCTHK